MTKSQRKDFIREIKRSLTRFLSILCMVALGVAFFVGVRSSEPDMRLSADAYYDETNFHDIRVVGTLGLTADDVEAIRNIDGITEVNGAYKSEALTAVNTDEYILTVYSICNDMNNLDIIEGRLPKQINECFADKLFIDATGLKPGDSITLISGTEDSITETLETDTYVITGYGTYAGYLSWERGSAGIGNGDVDAFLFLPVSAYSSDIYTDIYATVDSADVLNCYGDDYKDYIDSIIEDIEEIADVRCEIRYSSVMDEGAEKISEGEAEIKNTEDKLADAETELADAKQELADGAKELADAKQELADGEAKLEDGKQELADGAKEIEEAEQELAKGAKEIRDGKEKLEAAKREISEGREKLETGRKELSEKRAEYDEAVGKLDAAEQELDAGEAEYKTAKAKYEAVSAQLEEAGKQLDAYKMQLVAMGNLPETELQRMQAEYDIKEAEWNKANNELIENGKKLEETEAKIAAGREEIKAGRQELEAADSQLQTAEEELNKGEAQLKDSEAAYETGVSELAEAERRYQDGADKLADAQEKYREGEAELADAQREYQDGVVKLADAQKEYDEGVAELAEAELEFNDKKAEAKEEIADAKVKIEDAKQQLADIEMPEWYVLGRNAVQTFVEYDQDSERIGAIGKLFPVIFFLVAALVSLTTMTRMVEEERMQIGTLKALGYSKISIAAKYLLYALFAGIIGGIIGMLVGSDLLPFVIIKAYGILYVNIVNIITPINTGIAVSAIIIANLCTLAATFFACYKELLATPAVLMRPPAPKKGKRVFLEKINFIWKRLNFSKKATVRNLLRYKKRFFMTVIGIGGCMALLMVSFGLQDSIKEIVNNQYRTLWTYDAYLSVDGVVEGLAEKAEENTNIRETLYSRLVTTDVEVDGVTKKANLFIPETLENFADFVTLQDRTSKEKYAISEDGVVISEKLASLLSIERGDVFNIKKSDTETVEAVVTDITENYLYNYVYMSSDFYRDKFMEEVDYNQLLLKTEPLNEEIKEEIGLQMLKYDGVKAANFVIDLENTVNNMMNSLNMVIWVLIISAGLLAFVVLYNLNNINIIERRRELATIKVLGFYDGELAAYVYRENILLTVLGIIVGVFMGLVLHQFVIRTCEIDMIMFGREIKPLSYLYCILLTWLFTAVVNFVMLFKLKKIDMVESLKSVE